jgi:hypothetical protein
VADIDRSFSVGFCKPPQHTQFIKGQSGNPKGRPKGSQNVSTILRHAARQRVRVTCNGVSRFVTKLEAAVIQLLNQAAAGDARAIRELLYLHRLCEEPAQGLPAEAGRQEVDDLVMESIRKRILQSGDPQSDASDSKKTNSDEVE